MQTTLKLRALVPNKNTQQSSTKDPSNVAQTLQAPKLGRFTAVVEEGQQISPGQLLGHLRVLHSVYEITAPPKTQGRVVKLFAQRKEHPVQYAAPLLLLVESTLVDGAQTFQSEADSSLPKGGSYFDAPMDGQFYTRPDPDSPLFVQPGDEVVSGTVVGLIEVMKFFYPIAYEGTEPRRVHTICCEDGGAVSAGQHLLILVDDSAE